MINTHYRSGLVLRKGILEKVKTLSFDDFIILAFQKKWASLNNGKPLEFEIKLTKNGNLVLTSCLEKLAKTKDVITNEM